MKSLNVVGIRMALFAAVCMCRSSRQRLFVRAFAPSFASTTRRASAAIRRQQSAALFSTATTPSTTESIIPRVKTVDAVKATETPVVVKGWVRTIRKQKTLAFVQINDGSNLGGIQCVVSYDDVDDSSMKGKFQNAQSITRSRPLTTHSITTHKRVGQD